ncbi:hypothetical protein PoB_003574000 [Plakobranchus ocellatus]|uniref:Uncharacterized protein n=1 Tax=Plakobranchus ocellatus TaxID=259542 RepID=A0AAV4AM05_9GAST|nr:hypothetical protein PoB_003574000 [Plakobranchus ocellatus]
MQYLHFYFDKRLFSVTNIIFPDPFSLSERDQELLEIEKQTDSPGRPATPPVTLQWGHHASDEAARQRQAPLLSCPARGHLLFLFLTSKVTRGDGGDIKPGRSHTSRKPLATVPRLMSHQVTAGPVNKQPVRKKLQAPSLCWLWRVEAKTWTGHAFYKYKPRAVNIKQEGLTQTMGVSGEDEVMEQRAGGTVPRDPPCYLHRSFCRRFEGSNPPPPSWPPLHKDRQKLRLRAQSYSPLFRVLEEEEEAAELHKGAMNRDLDDVIECDRTRKDVKSV